MMRRRNLLSWVAALAALVTIAAYTALGQPVAALGLGELGAGFGRSGAIAGVRAADFRYPSFPYTTLADFRTTADIQNNFIGSAADVADPDSPYGSTSIQETFNGGTSTLVSKTILSTPVDVTNGMIQWTFKPENAILPTSSPLTTFNIRLYSAGTPASPSANYHQAFSATWLNTASTAVTGSNGRWQSHGVPTGQFVIGGGTGADLTQIKYALILARVSSGKTARIGSIRFYPNPLAKAKVIIRMDDGYKDAFTIAKPLLDAVGAGGFLAIGQANNVIGTNDTFWLNWTQIQALKNSGWQYGAQSYSTETKSVIDAMTSAQRLAEYANTRNLARTVNAYRDTYDGTYFSQVDQTDMINYPEFSTSFRTAQTFYNANLNQNPPLPFSEPFPFGDPKRIVAVNINSFGNGQQNGAGSTISQYLLLYLDMVRTTKGVAIIAMHNDLSVCANCLTAFNDMITYVTQTYPSQIEFVSGPRQLLAPYNGDNLQNFLLKRDLDPWSNDNTPAFMDRQAA